MGDLRLWHDWVNTGALAAFAVFACWMASRLVIHGGKKALELGERYIRSTEDLHKTLKDVEDARQTLCEQHADGVTALAKADHIRGGDIHRMKRAAVQACRMCREISRREIPQSADEVDRHCAEMERIIEEA